MKYEGGIGNEVPGASGLRVCVCLYTVSEWVCLCDVYVCLFVYLHIVCSVEETLVWVIGNLTKTTRSNAIARVQYA